MLKKNLAVIDTSVIIRFLTEDNEELFQKSIEIIEKIEQGDIRAFIPEGVLAECIFVLEKVYKVSRDEIVDKLTQILLLKGMVKKNRTLYLKALELYRTKKISFIDCLLCSYKNNGFDVLSFDKDIIKC